MLQNYFQIVKSDRLKNALIFRNNLEETVTETQETATSFLVHMKLSRDLNLYCLIL